ncbi:hypothetical protein [Azospirillum sp. B510]|uniref:hypothetical protein n=1 Tax=Azospirillum sp. (strain B510) TaxID=137722 RepID=UPI000305AAC1|nr:hypothetical protein [Azospirillum sp. B510]
MLSFLRQDSASVVPPVSSTGQTATAAPAAGVTEAPIRSLCLPAARIDGAG